MSKYRLNDAEHYTNEMAKALDEKLWFLKHVWIESMMDIGTADGTIPLHLSNMFEHNFRCYAYEPDYNLCWRAKIYASSISQPKSHRERVLFYDNYDKYLNVIKSKGQIDMILLSSVLHEIYNATKAKRRKVFRLLKESNSRYIAIRDMKSGYPDFSFIEPMGKIPNELWEKWEDHISVHEARRADSKNVHMEFFLKYRYDVNWDYEVKEDYFATDWEEIDMILRVLGYEKIFQEDYVPDFIEQNVEKTFNFSLTEEGYSTHTKMLYRFD